jgi:hypothetical protein
MSFLKASYKEGEKIYCPNCNNIMYYVTKDIYPETLSYQVVERLLYPDGSRVELDHPFFFCKSCGRYGFRKLRGFNFKAY